MKTMKDFKGTPGEWFYDKFPGESPAHIQFAIMSPSVLIAGFSCQDNFLIERESNANLIASSPKLLEACMEARSVIEALNDPASGHNFQGHFSTADFLTKLDAAINSALGN